MTEARCFICGASRHQSKDCKAPGGGKDPQKDKHWAAYKKLRQEKQNSTAKFANNGKGKNKGKGKGKEKSSKGKGKWNKGKSKGKGKTKDGAKTAQSTPAEEEASSSGNGADAKAVLEMRASAVSQPARFPRNAVALDSWANVW